ncbi:hypothetical protein [Streptomyces chrestomyceticus]|uniref:Transposase n=1 Tax=Streptomyces chrestomyceticus TaxID=68185 RepID=A0ABU7WT02_9ACTN
MDSEQELRAVIKTQAELEPFTGPERMRALARLLVFLRVDVVDVYQEAKHLGLLHQQGLVRGRPVNDEGLVACVTKRFGPVGAMEASGLPTSDRCGGRRVGCGSGGRGAGLP